MPVGGGGVSDDDKATDAPGNKVVPGDAIVLDRKMVEAWLRTRRGVWYHGVWHWRESAASKALADAIREQAEVRP